MKIAWIGTGVMGIRMVKRLAEANHIVYAYSRTPTKMDVIDHPNFVKCKSIPDAISNAEIIFTMLGYPGDVRDVYLDKKNGIIALADEKAICVDMTTSDPELAKLIFNNERKIDCLDAPVSGGDIGAENGTLSIMVGGKKGTYEKMLPILNVLGNNINYFGPAGSGQHAKLANQILVALNTAMTAEIISYCQDNNTDPEKAINIINHCSGHNWQTEICGNKILNGDFAPGFYIKHFMKDMKLIKQNSDKNLYGLNQVLKTYENFICNDGKNYNLGSQAIYKYYRKNKEEN